MAADNGNSDDPGRRISISEKRITEIVENAVLKLQIELTRLYALKEDVNRVEGDIRIVVKDFSSRIDHLDTKVEDLEKDKAGRQAVDSYKKWLIGGGIFTTLFAGLQLAISLYLLSNVGK